ncbi:hypothetical protein HUJ04_007289 [Dendroctonus ponderosae]|nr:hypothetical protein HUJ04_007289 [Dendroctonus ponderosae]
MVSDTFLGPPISIPCFCHQAQLISVPVVAFIASTLADNTEESETKMFFEMASCKPENKQSLNVTCSFSTYHTKIRMHSRSHFEMVTTTKVITDNGVLNLLTTRDLLLELRKRFGLKDWTRIREGSKKLKAFELRTNTLRIS